MHPNPEKGRGLHRSPLLDQTHNTIIEEDEKINTWKKSRSRSMKPNFFCWNLYIYVPMMRIYKSDGAKSGE